MRRPPLVAAAVTTLVLLSGCGVPADSSPRNIDLSEQPIGLQPASPPAAAGETDLLGPRVWYLFDDEGLTLRAVSRDVEQNYEDLLEVLLSGPNAVEQSEGILNQIPTGTRLLNVAPPDDIGTMAIDVSEEFLSTQQGPAVGNALGQLVLTATEDKSVRRVVVTVAGESYPWVVGDTRVDEGTGMSRETFQHLNPTEYTEPGVPPPTSPTTRPSAATTTTPRPRPPGVD